MRTPNGRPCRWCVCSRSTTRPHGAGLELVANRVQHEDAYIAVRDAFEDMQRQLEDWVRRRRGDEKQHATRTPLPG